MEECQVLGLTKSIGANNFSSKKLEHILSVSTIPPAVNQVEISPVWQQNKLREFCQAKGIIVAANSPLGAKDTSWGTNRVMDSEVLSEIAKAKGKTHAQIYLRWAYEQGVCVVVKSFNEERIACLWHGLTSLISFFTNTLILPAVNGPTEGLMLIYMAHFFTAIVGAEWWSRNFGESMAFLRWLPFISACIMCTMLFKQEKEACCWH